YSRSLTAKTTGDLVHDRVSLSSVVLAKGSSHSVLHHGGDDRLQGVGDSLRVGGASSDQTENAVGPRRVVHDRVTQVGAVLVARNAGGLRAGRQEGVVQLRKPLVDVVHPAENRLLVTGPGLERVVDRQFLSPCGIRRRVGHQALDNTTLSRHLQAIRVDLASRGVLLMPHKSVAAKAESLQQGSSTASVRVQLLRWPRMPRSTRVFRLDTNSVRV